MYALSCLGHLGDHANIDRIGKQMALKGQRWDFRYGASFEPFTDQSVNERLIEGLQKAGVLA